MTTAEVTYIAGILDGEGSVGVTFAPGGRYLKFRVDIGQADRRLIDWLQPRIGGAVYLDRRSGVWHLTLSKRQGVALLEAVRPFLIVKGEQADAFLHLAARSYVNGRRITDVELAERERLVLALADSRGCS